MPNIKVGEIEISLQRSIVKTRLNCLSKMAQNFQNYGRVSLAIVNVGVFCTCYYEMNASVRE